MNRLSHNPVSILHPDAHFVGRETEAHRALVVTSQVHTHTGELVMKVTLAPPLLGYQDSRSVSTWGRDECSPHGDSGWGCCCGTVCSAAACNTDTPYCTLISHLASLLPTQLPVISGKSSGKWFKCLNLSHPVGRPR